MATPPLGLQDLITFDRPTITKPFGHFERILKCVSDIAMISLSRKGFITTSELNLFFTPFQKHNDNFTLSSFPSYQLLIKKYSYQRSYHLLVIPLYDLHSFFAVFLVFRQFSKIVHFLRNRWFSLWKTGSLSLLIYIYIKSKFGVTHFAHSYTEPHTGKFKW